ncbi:MAG TPA: cupin domain-containing protein [Pseudonocardia sp.]|jgi:gentisate 1,2-dioxygenase|uniref:cupin domain-containing protein n=1 Tax=Pseudonocardia sp. TaxID=60912 RepID=UPI002ED7B657
MTSTDIPITDERAYASMSELSAAPLWRQYGQLMPAQPASNAVPHLWPYARLRPVALHFSQALSLAEAERRVLMMVNPGLTDPPATVPTLFAGIQIVMPGETARAHRHTANAFRFIIEGDGAVTTVNGEQLAMRPGDLLLTPGWHWHDHAHRGQSPVMWLDGLDYPLVNKLNAGFFELFDAPVQPVANPDDASSRQFRHGRLNPAWRSPSTEHPGVSPVGSYPWEETERALAAIAGPGTVAGSAAEGILLEYTNPWTGGPVLPTIACRIARLRAGFTGVPRQHTASTIYHVVSGSGSSTVGEQRLDWNEHDTFCVPGWARYAHQVATDGDATLFSYTDEPVLRALGMYREQWL